MTVREQLLPGDERIVNLGQSALHLSWMDRIDAEDGVFITAEGLLMYLDPAGVHTLLTACARRFRGGALMFDPMMFDPISHWFGRRTLKGFTLSGRYQAPPRPFAINADEAKNRPSKTARIRLSGPAGRR